MLTFSPTRLLAARAQAGLTQRQLGSLSGMSGAAISNYESGRYVPPAHVIGRLSMGLELTLPDLCEPDGDELFVLLASLDESRRRRALAVLTREVVAV